MGLKITVDYEVPYNPNLNPPPAFRKYTGITDGLMAAFQLDNSPSTMIPVAGSSLKPGRFSGGNPTKSALGYAFDNNEGMDSQAIPGNAVTGITMCCIARRTGFTPSGAIPEAPPIAIGAPTSKAYRLELLPTQLQAASAVSVDQAAPLAGSTAFWDFYVLSFSLSGCKMYRPRITTTPVTTAVGITTLGASQLDEAFYAGTGGTGVKWSEVEIMAWQCFNRQLTNTEAAITQYDAMVSYAAGKGITFGS